MDTASKVTVEQRYNGKVIARATSARRVGLNIEVTYSTGRTIVVAPSACAADVLALVS